MEQVATLRDPRPVVEVLREIGEPESIVKHARWRKPTGIKAKS